MSNVPKCIWTMVTVVFTAAIVSCSHEGKNDPVTPVTPADTTQTDPEPPAQGERNELYRPQIHFTPAKNWINDPNGMVYYDGVYHLFYQYNPRGNDWGNMSWGHATSPDMIHWTEQAVALTRDELGDIFSGSAVIDKNNTAGFGENAMVALYTSADGKQQQSLAYSLDGGKNFARYTGNPVIPNDDDNLRDPKVFWHEPTGKWIMLLAKGWKMGVEIYSSSNLKNWTHESTFFRELAGRPSLQWECPDMIELDGHWVMIVSVNPGGPLLGSGTMYFTGEFDGHTFTADERDYPIWLDYGMDNYAGVTWSNTGDRKIMIGWMNNWQYAGAVPCSPWRSAMTLPRELQLLEYDGKPILANTVVKEIDGIAGDWKEAGENIDYKDAYQLRLTISLDKNATITLANSDNEKYEISIFASSRELAAKRNAATGQTSFNGFFSVPSMRAPLNTTGDEVTLDIFVDQSSVEIFTLNGSMSMTNLLFPKEIYNRLTVSGTVVESKVRELKTIYQ